MRQQGGRDTETLAQPGMAPCGERTIARELAAFESRSDIVEFGSDGRRAIERDQHRSSEQADCGFV
jgi:hypothetical protein